ncbi:DNA-binding response regulator, OmpR family, contains REC and winged-helix (wHTH) domain [Caminicella sporogenes DSM 14501]|uniref:Stage 0 sporulation protein A homolog n=1 Tax=Caminicella sporogenes DSM 14501 TaxID=1121266 RepID=A0A1M6PCL7_9FIRM|nr:response regulator transcription factor [Caminicella sporogenes]RKD21449.1 DNA-binding response regulator [Caminicella sporogenes]SHK05684.1 DNA-binding response regulator, OmpR family, contains REC and winged-helix (wHTH) domain [Caminicella sporogenes DSM 14501]
MNKEKETILVVDDEQQIVSVVKAYLEKDGYTVYSAFDGKEALNIFENKDIDLIVLDLMLPDISGEEICKKIRIKSKVPILMLTAKVEEDDRVMGLNIGADDYMIKPFSPKELVARINAILRRTRQDEVKADIIEINNGDLEIDLKKMEVKKKGKVVKLTPTEFDILALFIRNIGRVFSREELVTKILGFDYEGYDRTIDVHIKNIRHKIDDEQFKYIKTVYGIGYKFVG